MSETQQLLVDYVENGSETAFRELVSRHLNLVYATALRLVGGDAHRAQEVAQTVFVQLAQNAHKLSRESTLGGWLHRTTCNVASKALRTERRRLERETQAMLMNAQTHEGEARMETVAPILDEAINQLGEEDRAAILLRFFEQRDFRAVGLALGSNEDAARMRVNRALEKLQGMLKRKGVALSATALGTMLTAGAASAAPAGLNVSIATVAFATATGVAGSGVAGFLQIMTQTKAIIASAVLVTGLAVTLAWQHQSAEQMKNENASLRKQTADLQAEMDALKRRPQPTVMASNFTDQERTELLRLRGEMGVLRRQLAEATKKNTQVVPFVSPVKPAVQTALQEAEEEAFQVKNVSNAKQTLLAFFMYSAENGGKFPEGFEQANRYIAGPTLDQVTNHFELYPVGNKADLNSNPGNIIALRGKIQQLAKGGWRRIYGMADGSVQTVVTADGDFTAIEAQREWSYPPAKQTGQP